MPNRGGYRREANADLTRLSRPVHVVGRILMKREVGVVLTDVGVQRQCASCRKPGSLLRFSILYRIKEERRCNKTILVSLRMTHWLTAANFREHIHAGWHAGDHVRKRAIESNGAVLASPPADGILHQCSESSPPTMPEHLSSYRLSAWRSPAARSLPKP
jgi:hypothetical protein